MAMVRVFSNPDGSLRIMGVAEKMRNVGESDVALVARIGAKTIAENPDLKGLSFIDVDVSALPADISKRYKWRIQAGAVVVDATIPDVVDPKVSLRARIAAANTLLELKAVIRDLVG